MKILASPCVAPLKNTGFTLIEVLLALAIIAIAFTALLKATGQNVVTTTRIQDKTLSHWVAMQGVSMIQLGMVTPALNREITEVTTLFNARWYWRVHLAPTLLKKVQQITVRVSQKPAGPFSDPLIAYRIIP